MESWDASAIQSTVELQHDCSWVAALQLMHIKKGAGKEEEEEVNEQMDQYSGCGGCVNGKYCFWQVHTT